MQFIQVLVWRLDKDIVKTGTKETYLAHLGGSFTKAIMSPLSPKDRGFLGNRWA